MKVLYVSHTSTIGGAERSLLDLLSSLPDRVSASVACPRGDLEDAVRALGIPVALLSGTTVSFRLHPVHTTHGLLEGTRSSLALRRAVRRTRPDLVHANSVRAGLIAFPVARLGGPPLVVHVRDCLPRSATGRLVRHAISSAASLILANSNFTAASFDDSGQNRVRTIYNPVDAARFDPARVDRAEARSELGLDDEAHALGVVAQLTPWKGQDDAIRVLAGLRDRGVSARLLLAGSARFSANGTRSDNAAYERSLRRLAAQLGVERQVDFLGEREDVPRVLGSLDVALVPSWEEPFGRAVVEAMAMELPVIATRVGGPAEIVVDGEDGLLLPPRSPDRWADAAARLLADRERRILIGRNARARILATFSRQAHVEAVLAGYSDVLAAG